MRMGGWRGNANLLEGSLQPPMNLTRLPQVQFGVLIGRHSNELLSIYFLFNEDTMLQPEEVEQIEVEVITVQVIASTDGGPIFKQYINFETRVSSFEPASRDIFPPYVSMARAGFFAIGVQDAVACFYCGVCLTSWSRLDSPWLEHQVYSPQCAYLVLNKDSIIQNVSNIRFNANSLHNYNLFNLIKNIIFTDQLR